MVQAKEAQMAQIIEMATQNVKNGFVKTYLEKYIGNGQIKMNMMVNAAELVTANLKAAFNCGSILLGLSMLGLTTTSSVKISSLVLVVSKSKLAGLINDIIVVINPDMIKDVLYI